MANCLWDGAGTGDTPPPGPRPWKPIVVRIAGRVFYIKESSDIDLGRHISAELRDLAGKLDLEDNQAILAEIPARWRDGLIAGGYDPVDAWVEQRRVDLIANRGRSAVPPELSSDPAPATQGAADQAGDDKVIDMRSALVEEFEEHLSSLSQCGRCASDKDEKCVDRWLIGEDRFSIDDIECGCGCWTRTAYRVQLGLEDDLPS